MEICVKIGDFEILDQSILKHMIISSIWECRYLYLRAIFFIYRSVSLKHPGLYSEFLVLIPDFEIHYFQNGSINEKLTIKTSVFYPFTKIFNYFIY